jgi:hypothetical protein
MKQPFSIISILCLSLSFAQFLWSRPSDDFLFISALTTPRAIDGQVDQIWQEVNVLPIIIVHTGAVENSNDSSAFWYGLYDSERLYILEDVLDDSLNSTTGSAKRRNGRSRSA